MSFNMITKIFNSFQIKEAAKLIKEGNVVAFPTETVYGLGANALNSSAVEKIFLAKKRPADNPLIVHVSNLNQVNSIAFFNLRAKRLAEKFWPGPLTLILRKKPIISGLVSAGLNTVAIRMPENKIALKLIELSGVPIAAPSANLSGTPSGTCFEHVFNDFNKRISGIIKSKQCKIGVESSVVDLTTSFPVLLRPGGMPLELLKKELPNLKIGYNKKIIRAKSPGLKHIHYTPRAKIICFEKSARDKISYYKGYYGGKNKKVSIIYPEKIKNFSRNLFSLFRNADKKGIDYILISAIDEKGIGLAVMDRIRRASFKIVK